MQLVMLPPAPAAQPSAMPVPIKVNPAHYYFNDLSPLEYEAMLEASEVENQSLD